MEDQKMIMLTNKSGRVYSTSLGSFHPGTSKEFPEDEAVKLLGYSNEIMRIEDAMKNPEVKDRVGKLELKLTEMEALVKAKDGAIKILREKGDSDEIGKELKKKIKGLEGYIKELEKSLKEYSEGVTEQNEKLEKKDARITELENMLKDKPKKGKKEKKK